MPSTPRRVAQGGARRAAAGALQPLGRLGESQRSRAGFQPHPVLAPDGGRAALPCPATIPVFASSGSSTALPAGRSARILARSWARLRDQYLDPGWVQRHPGDREHPATLLQESLDADPGEQDRPALQPGLRSKPSCSASARKATSPARWSSTWAMPSASQILLCLDAGHFHPTEGDRR